MKKLVIVFSVICLFTASLVLSSCKETSCADLETAVSDAATNWSADPTNNDLCIAYKDAINDYFDGCDAIDDATKQQYEDAMSLLDCK